MQRRKFLALPSLTGISAVSLLSPQFSLKRKTKDLLKSVLYFFKSTFDLPEEGKDTSVESAKNYIRIVQQTTHFTIQCEKDSTRITRYSLKYCKLSKLRPSCVCGMVLAFSTPQSAR